MKLDADEKELLEFVERGARNYQTLTRVCCASMHRAASGKSNEHTVTIEPGRLFQRRSSGSDSTARRYR